MFRCPSCAVVWKLPLTKGHSLLTTKNMDKFSIYREPITLLSRVEVIDGLLDLAESLNKLGLDFQYTDISYPEDYEIKESDPTHGIKCPNCKDVHTFEQWHRAWDFPMDYFDADALCSCGGELWWDKIPGTPRFAHVCEECGWAKPRAVISGHE